MRTPHGTRGASGIADWFFGGTCYLCRGESRSGVVCAACRADLPRLSPLRCPRCALPVAQGLPCGRCIGDPPAYDATVAVFEYAFPADVLVQGLKFRGELALAPLLADQLAEEVRAGATGNVDLIIPAPLHPDRLAKRGFNQAMEIARRVAARLTLPLAADLCERVRPTPAQTDLPLKGRRENVRGAFGCRRRLDARRIAVVDDVMTTGATLDEIAATLKKSGATRVVNWVVARTMIE